MLHPITTAALYRASVRRIAKYLDMHAHELDALVWHNTFQGRDKTPKPLHVSLREVRARILHQLRNDS